MVVNDKVWNLYLANYNGGPEISLSKNDDIYNSIIGIEDADRLSYDTLKENLGASLNASGSSGNDSKIHNNPNEYSGELNDKYKEGNLIKVPSEKNKKKHKLGNEIVK